MSSAGPTQVVVPPKALSNLKLGYPPEESGSHDVELALLIGRLGTVEDVRVVSGDPPFSEIAKHTAASWIFTPAMSEGRAVAAWIQVQAHFEQETQAQQTDPETSVSEVPPSTPDVVEVTVFGERRLPPTTLDKSEVRALPGAFGDPFRATETLPGVTPMLSGLPYFQVRGAPPGDVGYYFAGVPVPALYHIGVGPGVLHPAFVERVVLHAGAYSVQYGRHGGGLLLGELAEPSYERRAEFGARLTEASAFIEAPAYANNGSLMVGGRYGYPGLVLSLISSDLDLSYWDYQGLFNYQLGANERLEVLAFGASDYLAEERLRFDEEGGPLGEPVSETVFLSRFHRLDLRWMSETDGNKSFVAGTVGLDNSEVGGFGAAQSFLLGLRGNYTWRYSQDLSFQVGTDVRADLRKVTMGEEEQGTIVPPRDGATSSPRRQPTVPVFASRQSSGELSHLDDDNPQTKLDDETEQAVKQQLGGTRGDYVFGAYAGATWNATRSLIFSPGLRLDTYVSGNQAALAIEPRVNLKYQITPDVSVTNAFGIAHQMPAFVVPVPGVQPSLRGGLQRSVQHSAGVEWRLPEGFHSSATLFQNLFFNVSDPLGVTRFSETADGSGMSLLGRAQGRSVGLELMIRRNLARDLGGLVSYTLSRSTRSQQRGTGPASFDRTHVINVALTKDLGRDWSLGSRVVFYTGTPARVPYLAATADPPRGSPFFRLDWRLEKRWYIERPDYWWAFTAEVLNTTLQQESLASSCHAFACSEQYLAPTTIPNLGIEARF